MARRSFYWNRRIRDIEPYVPGEQPGGRKFIKLNTNENPYPPSPLAVEAVQRLLVRGGGADLRLYPDPECRALREAVAERYGVEPEQVFAGNGSDEVLAFAFGAFFEPRNGSPGKEDLPLLFPDITYSFYPVYAELWDIPVKTVPLEDDFSIDHKKYLVPSAGAVIPNPNAPTAMILPVKDLLAIAEYQEKQGGGKMPVLMVDEAYAAFGAETAVPFINGHPGLLTVHTLSKMGALAGLRVGFAIGNGELIEGLRRVRDSFNSYTVDALAQAAAAAAISDRAYYDGITARIAATRVRVSSALAGMGFTVLPSGANFIFIKPPGGGETPEGRPGAVPGGAEFFYALRERGILVRHFNRKRIAPYFRVTIGADEEMDRFLEACGEILKT